MASLTRSDAARINGAKSSGLKHGLTAEFHALPGESNEALKELIAAYRSRLQPVGALEDELVRSLAIARWRLSRVALLESNLFENELCLSEEDIDKEYTEIDGPGRLAFVFQKLADDGHALTLLMRYESSLTRVYERTFKHLLTIQKLRKEPLISGTLIPGNENHPVSDELCSQNYETNPAPGVQPGALRPEPPHFGGLCDLGVTGVKIHFRKNPSTPSQPNPDCKGGDSADSSPASPGQTTERSPTAHRKWSECLPLTTASPVSASRSPDGRSSAATNYDRR